MCLGELVEVVGIGTDGSAEVVHSGRHSIVSLLALDDPVLVGDWLVVHSGLALERVTPAEAREAALIRAASRTEESSG